MCQWLPLPKSAHHVCYTCMHVQCDAGFLASDEDYWPVKIKRIGDGFMPLKNLFGRPRTDRERDLVRYVNNNSGMLYDRYVAWLGRQMLEELLDEQE